MGSSTSKRVSDARTKRTPNAATGHFGASRPATAAPPKAMPMARNVENPRSDASHATMVATTAIATSDAGHARRTRSPRLIATTAAG